MQLDKMREFLKVVEMGSFRKAAESLFMSKSTLLRHVADLESAYGHPLLIRSNPPEPTPAGRIFIEYVRKVFELDNIMHDHLESLGDSPCMRVRIPLQFANKGEAAMEMTKVIIRNSLMGIELEPVPLERRGISESLKTGLIDIGIVEAFSFNDAALNVPDNEIEFAFLKATTQAVIVLCNQEGALSKKRSVTFEELSDYRIGVLSSFSHEELAKSARMLGSAYYCEMDVSLDHVSMQSLQQQVCDNMAVLAPASVATCLRHERMDSTAVIPLDERIRIGLSVALRKGWMDSLVERIRLLSHEKSWYSAASGALPQPLMRPFENL